MGSEYKKNSTEISQEFKKHVKLFSSNEDGPRTHEAIDRREILSKIDKGGFITTECFKKTNTPEKLLEQFDPRPSLKVQEKIDYFFIPYNFEYTVSKSMKFRSNQKEQNQVLNSKLRRISNDPYASSQERDLANEQIN